MRRRDVFHDDWLLTQIRYIAEGLRNWTASKPFFRSQTYFDRVRNSSVFRLYKAYITTFLLQMRSHNYKYITVH